MLLGFNPESHFYNCLSMLKQLPMDTMVIVFPAILTHILVVDWPAGYQTACNLIVHFRGFINTVEFISCTRGRFVHSNFSSHVPFPVSITKEAIFGAVRHRQEIYFRQDEAPAIGGITAT